MESKSGLLQSQPFRLQYDWCSGHFDSWSSWFGSLRDGPSSLLEIGSFEGASAIFWLSEILIHPDSQLTLIDHFDANEGAGRQRRLKLDHNVNLALHGRNGGHRSKVKVVSSSSLPALIELQRKAAAYDVVYVDGDHSQKGVLADALLSWPMVKMGGYMLFDDYLWPTKGAPSSWPCSPASSSSPDHPKLGIDHFLSTMGAELEVIHKGYQVLVRKVVQGPCYPFHVEPGTIQVLMAFDEASVMPAAVAICSMYRSCSSPQSIRLGIIDLGLQGESRARIQQLALGTIDWLSTEQATIHRGGTKHPRVSCCSSSDPPIPAHTWIKLGLGAAASHRTERALYLDADVLVRGDVCELWESTKGMKVAVCAVPDFGHPRGHAGLPADTWDPHLCAYFNAGVFVLDIAAFQSQEPRLSSLAASRSWKYDDQDVLNMGFAKRWLPLDPAWNAQGLGSYAGFRTTASADQPALFTPKSLHDLASDPKIVHFCGSSKLTLEAIGSKFCPPTLKPWHGACPNPFAGEWFKWLDQTPWKGWRPDKGSSGRGVTGCEAVQSSRRRTYARRRMADSNPPD